MEKKDGMDHNRAGGLHCPGAGIEGGDERMSDAQRIHDLEVAREWAENHFNVNGPDTLLDPPAFDIDFIDVDKMVVYPRFMGERIPIGITYRLKWHGAVVGWEGTHLITGKKWWLAASTK